MSNIELFVDSGAPSLYNTLMRKKEGSHMGAYLEDRKFDDFSFLETEEYLTYRDDYISYIKRNIKIIDFYVNLDIINNAQATWKNQKYFESKGLSPIPVFHFGNDEKYLKRYIRKGYKYIAIGGMVPNPPKILIPALDRIWGDILTDEKGFPLVKVHGFALTSPRLMARYPWYSVDSTSWVKFSKYGSVIIPKVKNGKKMFASSPRIICLSIRSPQQKKEDGNHFFTMSKIEQNKILEYFKEKGFEMGESCLDDEGKEQIITLGLCNNGILRDQLNMMFYLDIEKVTPEWPWAFKQSSGNLL